MKQDPRKIVLIAMTAIVIAIVVYEAYAPPKR